MQRRPVPGRRVGTFAGSAGDQFSQVEGMTELLVEDAGVDPETEESLVTITLRQEQPVDEVRMAITMPAYAFEHFVETVRRSL